MTPEDWGALSPAWKKAIFVSHSVCSDGTEGDIRYLLNPDVDQVAWAYKTILHRDLAIPKKLHAGTLAKLTSLPALACYSSKIDDLAPLRHFSKLEYLNARKNPTLVSIAPVAEVGALRELSLLLTAVRDLTPLRGLRKLETLMVFGTKVVDLAPVAELPLRTLSIGKCAVVDLAPVPTSHLESLWIPQTKIASLMPLARACRLRELVAYRTKIADLAPLAGLPELERIQIFSTAVKDFAPLATLPKLAHVEVDRGLVSAVRAALAGKSSRVEVRGV